jgi:hypothetical protein
MLRRLFARAAHALPLAQVGETHRPYPAHVPAHVIDAQSSALDGSLDHEPERAPR